MAFGTATTTSGAANLTISTLPYSGGSPYTVTATYGTSTGALSGGQQVNQYPLTLTGAAAQSKLYDGTANAIITGGTLSATVNGDVIGTNAAFAQATAGRNISVNVTLTGPAAADYSLSLVSPSSLAADILSAATWTNTAGGLWGTSGNWLDGIIGTGSGNTADFSQADLTADTTVNLDAARTIGNLLIGNTDATPNANWILGNNGNWANTLTLAGGTPTITVNALGTGKSATISAVVAGTAGLLQTGATGTLVLSGTNTFTGTVNVVGTLVVENNQALGSGNKSVYLNGGTGAQPSTMQLNGNGGNLTLPASFSFLTSYPTEPGAINNVAGSNVINGSISLTTGNNSTLITATGGSLTLDGVITNIASARTLLLGGTTVGTVNGVIVDGANGAGALSLTKQDAGTWTLANVNTYSGATAINGGTLLVTGSTGSSSAVSVANGATLGGTGTINGTVSVSNGGTIQPTLSGSVGTLTLANSSSPTFAATGTLHLRVPASATADEVYLSNSSASFACGNLNLVIDTTGLSGNVSGLTIVQAAKTSGGITGTFNSVLANNGYTATVHYNAQTITLDLCNTPPTAGSASASAASVCSGTSTTISLTGSSGATTWQWQQSANGATWANVTGGSGGATATYTTPNLTTATYYQCVEGNGSACSATSAAMEVTVNALPTPAAGNSGPVCVGSPLSLTSSGGVGYTWSGPNGFSSTAQNPSVSSSATLAMAGTYTVIVTNASGCTASTTTAVTVNVLPTTTAITGTNSVQQLTSATYSVASTAGSTYGWTVPGDASFTGGTGNSISVTFGTTSGNVSVIETNASGCTGTPQSLNVTVITCTAPAIVGGIDPGSLTVTVGNPVVLTVTNVTGTAPLYYQWQSNNVDLAGATYSSYTNLSVTVADAGNYQVVVTNGCGSITSSIAVLAVNPQTPLIATAPTAGTAITYGQTLSAAGLTGGSVTNAAGVTLAGSFAYTSPATVPDAGTPAESVTFTPADTNNYSSASTTVSVTVNSALLTITANNDSKMYGQTRTYGSGSTAYAITSGTLTNGDAISTVTITDTDDGGVATAAAGGTYYLTPSAAVFTTGTAANYTITYNPGLLTVGQAGTFVGASSSENPSGYRDSISFQATLPSDATGSVVFSSTNGPISTNSVGSGSATSLSITNLPRGTNVITVAYLGDGNYLGSSTNLNQVVTNHPPTASVMTVTCTETLSLLVALSNLATNWSDVDGDTVELTGINLTTTNGVTLYPVNLTTNLDGSYVITNIAYFYYANPTNAMNDQFSYSIEDGQGGTNIGYVNIVISTNAVTGQSINISATGGGPATVNFAGIIGFSYSVQRSTNLVDWVTIWTTNTPAGGLFNYTDSYGDLGGNTPSAAYYRLAWIP